MFNLKKKVLFGVSVSMVLAMAIGSFAFGDSQTPTMSQASNDDHSFDVITSGTEGVDGDYNYETETDTDPMHNPATYEVLCIHPKSSSTSFEIKNKTDDATHDRIAITAGPQDAEKTVNVTLNGVNINVIAKYAFGSRAPLGIAENAKFDVKIKLADGSKNSFTKLGTNAILDKSDDGTVPVEELGTLTIEGSGELTAVNYSGDGAGIGGGPNKNGSNITINGGTIIVKGTYFVGAGIGGGLAYTLPESKLGGDGRNIIINGGHVTVGGVSGIGGGQNGNGDGIIINGGEVEAYGLGGGAGIGGGVDGDDKRDEEGNGKNITITGGIVRAYGGSQAAGIGGGAWGNGSNITISGGAVTAQGDNGAAGIGGGMVGNAENIEITGGVVKAIGGHDEGILPDSQEYFSIAGTGIGAGDKLTDEFDPSVSSGGEAKNNKISGNAVVFAISGGKDNASGELVVEEPLQGFDEESGGSITQGVVFAGVGTFEKNDEDKWELKSVDWDDAEVYGDTVLVENLELATTFTVPEKTSLTINKGVTLTVPDKMSLKNKGTINVNGKVDCLGSGKVETLLNYDTQGGTINTNDDNYKTYQDASGIKSYENLPSVVRDGCTFDGWYTGVGEKAGEMVEEDTNVLLNQHTLYASWTEPTPEPTPDPSVNPDGGDGSGSGSGNSASSKTSDPFMGGIALALLGVATTGAILTRKFR